MRDYYKILRISKNASKDDISKSFHMLVNKYHPDKKNLGWNTDKFREIINAYRTLSNEKERTQYDSCNRTFLGDILKELSQWRRRIKEKRIQRAEKEKLKRIYLEEENKIAKEKKDCKERQEKEARMAEYQQLRKEIEAMPKYANWKNAVFSKIGMVCEMCGGTNNLEIHHRQSFYSIIQAYQIKNVVQAFETNALWEIDNGSVLCRECHTKMTSSKYHNLNNL